MPSGVRLVRSTALAIDIIDATVTALVPSGMPRSTPSGTHGLASSSSPKQNE